MFVIGLTGGIGSGKTTVANLFKEIGIGVYSSDNRGKYLMHNSASLKNSIKKAFGSDSYINEKLNKNYIAAIVFNDKKKLSILNNLIHPRVKIDFEKWKNKQKGDFIIKESAILFESGAYKDCDITINIYSSKKNRIKRVIKRDATSEKQVIERINNQLTDKERSKKADITLENNGDLELLKENVKKIYQYILSLPKISTSQQ